MADLPFAHFGSKFFCFRVEPFSEGNWCAVKQKENHKKLSKIEENLRSIYSLTPPPRKHLLLLEHIQQTTN